MMGVIQTRNKELILKRKLFNAGTTQPRDGEFSPRNSCSCRANFVLTAEITGDWPVSVAFTEVQEIIIDTISDDPSLASIHELLCNDYLMWIAVYWKCLH